MQDICNEQADTHTTAAVKQYPLGMLDRTKNGDVGRVASALQQRERCSAVVSVRVRSVERAVFEKAAVEGAAVEAVEARLSDGVSRESETARVPRRREQRIEKVREVVCVRKERQETQGVMRMNE